MRLKRLRSVAAAVFAIGFGAWLPGMAQSPGNGGVFVLAIQDAIGPATSGYLTKGIARANASGAALIVIEMDTPGGLDTSMREIIQAILSSRVPVATYVYPEGARAASAGTYILYASDIAAMAPATNLGAATPVSIGGGGGLPLPGGDKPSDEGDEGDLSTGGKPPDTSAAEPAAPAGRFPEPASTEERKAINDAVAYIRSLAERRDRNADWAERAVRGSESLSARAALDAGVIDLIASDLDNLLRQLDGRIIRGSRLSLPADSTPVTEIMPDWRSRILAAITNPTVAYMLLLLGIYGLVFEGYNPGATLPGVVGAIALVTALFALQILPVNYAGLALILLGVVLIIAEFFVPSFGALGIGGIAAFVIGSLVLFDTGVPGFEVARSLIAGVAFSAALLLAGTIWLAVRAHERRVVSGVEEMQGLTAEALEDFAAEGLVWVHGERWRARTPAPVTKGQRLRVVGVEGLVLEVEAAGPSQHTG